MHNKLFLSHRDIQHALEVCSTLLFQEFSSPKASLVMGLSTEKGRGLIVDELWIMRKKNDTGKKNSAACSAGLLRSKAVRLQEFSKLENFP